MARVGPVAFAEKAEGPINLADACGGGVDTGEAVRGAFCAETTDEAREFDGTTLLLTESDCD